MSLTPETTPHFPDRNYATKRLADAIVAIHSFAASDFVGAILQRPDASKHTYTNPITEVTCGVDKAVEVSGALVWSMLVASAAQRQTAVYPFIKPEVATELGLITTGSFSKEPGALIITGYKNISPAKKEEQLSCSGTERNEIELFTSKWLVQGPSLKYPHAPQGVSLGYHPDTNDKVTTKFIPVDELPLETIVAVGQVAHNCLDAVTKLCLQTDEIEDYLRNF